MMKTISEKVAKKVFLFLTMVSFSIVSSAATYYVSNSGNDTNSGLATALAWKTLTKVNATTFAAGDQILFNKGETFYGSLTISQSGSSGSPITIGTYGTGANPIITGFASVTAWTNLGSNIWESTNAASTLSTCNMVVINGVNTAMGRYPNSNAANGGYLIINASSGTSSITNNTLTGTPDWTGATAVVRTSKWTLDKAVITSQSTSTLNLAAGETYTPSINYGFFIQNDGRTLDTQNEWYYNTSTKKLRIYSTSQPTNVKVTSVDNLLNANGSYLTIDGVDFTGANSYSIYNILSKTNLTIQNCNISFTGIDGIHLKNSHLLIDNCIVLNSNNTGIDLSEGVPYATITNTTVQNSGAIAGMGLNAIAKYSGISSRNVANVKTTVEYCKVINSGYNGIIFYGDSAKIKNNFVDTFCLTLNDGAGIYTWTGGNPEKKELKVIGNIVINGIGAPIGTSSGSAIAYGIYADDYTANIEIANNTVAYCGEYGIFLHVTKRANVNNNTCYKNANQLLYNDDVVGGYSSENNISGNIFINPSTSDHSVQYRSVSNVINPGGTYNNNFYIHLLNTYNTIRVGSPIVSYANYTLEWWQTYSGQDANSKNTPQVIRTETDLQFEYNETKTAQTVTLSQPMIDVKGTKYAGSIALQPYASVVLLKDNNPAIVPQAPTSVVATAGNASASITFVAPVNDGGSVITGYTVTSIPAGGNDLNAGSTSLTHTITGLTNGTSYTFTVKAMNSVGSSAASAASNSVIPKAPVDTGFLFIGPSSGNVNSASANFTVTPNNSYTGTITITPTGTGSTGLTAKVLTFSNSSASQTFTITPTVAGSINLTPTNNGTLTNSATLTYASNAVVAAAPTSVVAVAGNTSASISFVAPSNTGGTAITGYNVTSIPAGGTDSNAGSTSLTHTITGLTNGTSYIFTVKATNSAGNSVASVASNSVIPTAPIESSQILELKKGYNMISTNLTPSNPIVSDVTQPIVADGNLIKIQDESGNSFENWGSFGGWINNLGSIQSTEGYKIKVADDCTLQLTGRLVALPLDIPLNAGWNIISFPRTDALDAMVIIQSLIDQNKLIKVQDEAGNSIEDWGIYGGWKNGIGNFIPGKAYRVKMSASAVLTIQQNYPKSANIPVYAEKTSYFTSEAEGNGVDHMNINLVGLNEAGLSAGDELAAFDGTICVGTLKITHSNLTIGSASLVASSSTSSQLKDGFKDGTSVQLYVWNHMSGLENKVEAAAIKGSLNYQKNASILVKMKSLTTSASPLNANIVQTEVYPNPSQGRFTVRFSELPEPGSRIEIFDLSGRKVASRLITGISEELNLYGQAAGLYLVKSILGSSEKIQKLVIQ